MEQALRTREAPVERTETPDLARRLHGFRSLGRNCEFGFVQRYGGAEPSGLLRFSFTPLDDLIHALATDFSELGAPGDLRIVETETGSYYCASTRYDIWSNTGETPATIAAGALLEREYGRTAHLKRKMLDELAEGSKILVRKASPAEPDADVERLAQALWRHGPSTLLRVSEAGPGWVREPVRQVDDRLLEGSVRRFAPVEQAWDLELEPWLWLCDSAYAARHGLSEADLGAGPFTPAMDFPTGLRRHRGRAREPGLRSFARAVAPGGFDPGRIYVFSTWVWLPQDFSASRVFAVAGRERLGWSDADLTIRDRWQRVWSAGRFKPGDEAVPVGLGMIGEREDGFWSLGAQMHEGPVPRPAEPPAIVPSALHRFLPW